MNHFWFHYSIVTQSHNVQHIHCGPYFNIPSMKMLKLAYANTRPAQQKQPRLPGTKQQLESKLLAVFRLDPVSLQPADQIHHLGAGGRWWMQPVDCILPTPGLAQWSFEL